MSIYLLDFGNFETLSRIYERNRSNRTRCRSTDYNSSENHQNSESHSRDGEAEDSVPSLSNACPGHIVKKPNSDRRMSVPQLSRNRSVVKVREQRITSVVGIPHRHNITIAVNDEPVDVIKTTCTGPCLQSCHSNFAAKKMSSISSIGSKVIHRISNVENNSSGNKIHPTNIVILTIIYVISSISMRSIFNLYTTLFGTTALYRKLSFSIFYFVNGILTICISLNHQGRSNFVTNRIKLILSIVITILWSGLNLVPQMPLVLIIINALILAIGRCFMWDSQLRLLSKWSFTNSRVSHVNSFSDVLSRSNIFPTISVISHSLHIWANILAFLLLETTSSVTFTKPIKTFDHNVTSANYSHTCGIRWKIGSDLPENEKWKDPHRALYCLCYISIALNIVSLVLAVVMMKKSQAVRMPGQTVDVDSARAMLTRNSSHDDSNLLNKNLCHAVKTQISKWLQTNSNIILKIWDFKFFRYTLPTLLTMGFLEGFLMSDFNEKFVSCYKKPSFIGLSMLTFAICPVIYVNINFIFTKFRFAQIIVSPIVRGLLLLSFILLSVTDAGVHWTYLLIFFPMVVALDTTVCLTMFYIVSSTLPDNLLDCAIVLHRVLRMFGIAIYMLVSTLSGTFVATIMTLAMHCFFSTMVVFLSSFSKCATG